MSLETNEDVSIEEWHMAKVEGGNKYYFCRNWEPSTGQQSCCRLTHSQPGSQSMFLKVPGVLYCTRNVSRLGGSRKIRGDHMNINKLYDSKAWEIYIGFLTCSKDSGSHTSSKCDIWEALIFMSNPQDLVVTMELGLKIGYDVNSGVRSTTHLHSVHSMSWCTCRAAFTAGVFK